MPPKPTRTPERIDEAGNDWLPVGWVIYEGMNRQPCIATPEGDIASFADEKAWSVLKALAKDMGALQSPAIGGIDWAKPDAERCYIDGVEQPIPLQSPAGEWRDISTAPHELLNVIQAGRFLPCGGFQQWVAFWEDGLWHAGFEADELNQPTHWLPLPPAPTGEG